MNNQRTTEKDSKSDEPVKPKPDDSATGGGPAEPKNPEPEEADVAESAKKNEEVLAPDGLPGPKEDATRIP